MTKTNLVLIITALSISFLQSCKKDSFSEFQTIDSKTSPFYSSIPGCYFYSEYAKGNNFKFAIKQNGSFLFVLTDAGLPCECINGEWKLKDSLLILKSTQTKMFSCHGQNEIDLGIWQNDENIILSFQINAVTDSTIVIKSKRNKCFSYKKSNPSNNELFESCN